MTSNCILHYSSAIIESNRLVWRALCKAVRADRPAEERCRRCSEQAELRSVVDLPVDEDDSDLPDSMQGKQWTFSGSHCWYCGARAYGTYRQAT